MSEVKCNCDERKIAKNRVLYIDKILDYELDVNYDGTINGQDKNPIAIKRKGMATDGKDNIKVILHGEHYRVVCCVKDKDIRVAYCADLKEPYSFLQSFPVVVAPPKPPTKTNMKNILNFVFPVPYWHSFTDKQEETECLKKAKEGNTGPNNTIPKRSFDTP